MQLQLIRSATLRLAYAGRRYLVDPWLAPKNGGLSYAGGSRSPLVGLPLPVDEIVRGIDAVIVSHLHSDHFDDSARRALDPGVRLICAERDADAIRDHGFRNVVPVSETVRDGTATIAVAPGRHGPEEVLADMGEVSGFVLRAEGEPTVYWAGDTIFCDAVRTTIKAVEPDVIVVHACGATWRGMGPLVMDEGMVAEVLRSAPAATVVATHLDAVDHATVGRDSLTTFFAGHPGLRARLLVPADGETLDFSTAAS